METISTEIPPASRDSFPGAEPAAAGAPTTPFISVLIPVRNGGDSIKSCLASLLSVDYPEDRREIIVVDNGSTDGTAEIVRGLPVMYQVERNRVGAPAARNTGIRVAKGEILAFTDADCVVTRGWLREIARAFQDSGVGAVAGEILPYPPRTPAERYAARIRHLSPRKYLARPWLPFAVFANLAFRREVFEQIGLLDEKLIQGDSTDFCTRFIRGTGLRLALVPQAGVFHRHRSTTWDFLTQQWNYGRGHALLYIKYRQEIPWGWRQTVLAYRELFRATGALIAGGFRLRSDPAAREELSFRYFEFLKRVAERGGFVRQSLADGYFYL
jgi:GT2 family glycosyltransferase